MIKEVADNPNYLVTSDGVVLNKKTGKPLKPQVWMEYHRVYLMYGADDKVRRIHRLVAEAFLDNPLGYAEVNHINLDKSDNQASNLEWCSRKQNVQHAVQKGRWHQGWEKRRLAK